MRDKLGRFIKGNSGFWTGKKRGMIPKSAFKEGDKIGVKTLNKWRANGGKPWNKNRPFTQIKGSNHWNWQGGKTKTAEYIRFTFEYKQWQKIVFERDNYTCQICLMRGGRLNADHIKPQSLYPELRFDIENGRTLCADCHRKTDTYGFKTKKLSNDYGTLSTSLGNI